MNQVPIIKEQVLFLPLGVQRRDVFHLEQEEGVHGKGFRKESTDATTQKPGPLV